MSDSFFLCETDAKIYIILTISTKWDYVKKTERLNLEFNLNQYYDDSLYCFS